MDLYLTGRKRLSLPDDHDLSPLDMPIDTALRALDVAAQSPRNVVCLTGNEPMLYPEIEQLFASCRKRNLGILVETTGLMPTQGRTLLAEESMGIVLLKTYRPGLMGEEDRHEREETVRYLLEHDRKISLLVLVDDVTADYSFVMEELKHYGLHDAVFRFSCRHEPEELRPFCHWFASVYAPSLLSGCRLLLECGSFPCLFSDSDFGKLSKSGCKLDSCTPHPGVIPDGRVVHCREMLSLPGHSISTFKQERELVGYFYESFKDLQWQPSRNPECAGCLSRRVSLCTGLSLASKADSVQEEYQRLRSEFDQEERDGASAENEEDRLEKLWRLGSCCLMLGKMADAIECLEEIRGFHPELERIHFLLGIAYWECGRHGDGEEEFKKAARLSQEPLPILLELHKRLVRNGNTIKARILQAEIEKLRVSQQG